MEGHFAICLKTKAPATRPSHASRVVPRGGRGQMRAHPQGLRGDSASQQGKGWSSAPQGPQGSKGTLGGTKHRHASLV